MRVRANVYNPSVESELNILEELLGGRNRVAEVLKVNRSQIAKWHRAARPDSKNIAKIYGLSFVIAKLLAYYKYPKSALLWLEGNNPVLGYQTPLQLIAQERIIEVAAAVDQMEAGAYA